MTEHNREEWRLASYFIFMSGVVGRGKRGRGLYVEGEMNAGESQ